MPATLPTSKRISLLIAGFLAVVLTHFGAYMYREASLGDARLSSSLAGSAPSFGGTVGTMLLFSGLFANTPVAAMRAAFGVGVGCLMYEFIQPIVRTGVFDWFDVLAIFVGLVVGMLVVLVIVRIGRSRLWPTSSLEQSRDT